MNYLLWGMLGSSVLVYMAFQKHLFPKPIARVVSKIYFYPTVPISISLRLNNYWTFLDGLCISS